MGYSMRFELAMSQYFGKRAYQIAGSARVPRLRSRWLRKAASQILKDIDTIDSTSRHKMSLMRDAEDIRSEIRSGEHPSWELVYVLFSICSRFLGYDYLGKRCNTPAYFQTSQQLQAEKVAAGTYWQEVPEAKKTAIEIRARLCGELQRSGLEIYKIGLVMNATEHEVKKLLREIA